MAIFVLSLLAQLSVDLNFKEHEIPVTGQTLGVMMVSLLLSKNEALISIFLYLLIGCIGIPVFAEGGSGTDVLIGKSGGYLMSFLLVPLFLSNKNQIYWNKSWQNCFMANMLGSAVVLFFGGVWLAQFIGLSKAWTYGVLPFIPGGIIKSILGAFTVILFLRFYGRNDRSVA